MAKIGSLTADLHMETAAFLRDMRKAGQAVATNTAQMRKSMRRVETASRGVQKAFGQVRTGAAALGGALAVRQFTQFTRSAIDAGAAILDTSKKVSVTTDTLQKLRYSAAQVGVNQRTLDMGMQRFSRRVGEAAHGAGELKDTLRLYNVAVRNADGTTRSNIDVLFDFADALQNAGSEQEQLRMAFKAFDSEGAALVNMLRDGREGLELFMRQAEDFGVVMSRQVVAQSKIASDNLTALQFIANAAFNTAVVQAFAGSLTLTRENMESVRVAAENFGRAVGMAMRGVSAAAKLVGEYLREIVAVIAGLIAMKVASMFAGAGLAVWKFGMALAAATKPAALLGLILSKNVIGAAVSLAIALGVAKLAAETFEKEIEKVSKAMEEAGKLFSGTGSDIGSATNKIRDSIKAKQQEVENWNKLTAALRQGDEEYRRVKDSLDLVTEAEQIGAKAGTKLGDEWRRSAAAAQQAQRANEELAESFNQATALGEEVGYTIGSAFSDAVIEGKRLQDMLQALLKDLARIALQRAVVGPLADSFGSIFRPLGAATAHSGGVIGVDSMPKTVLPAMAWAGAPKFHGGGVVGGGDEIPILARRYEEVLTPEDPRHRFNLSAAPFAGMRQANAIIVDSFARVREMTESFGQAITLGRQMGQTITSAFNDAIAESKRLQDMQQKLALPAKAFLPAMARADAPEFYDDIGDGVPSPARRAERMFGREQMRALGIGRGGADAPQVVVNVTNNAGADVQVGRPQLSADGRTVNIDMLVQDLESRLADRKARGQGDLARVDNRSSLRG